MPTGYRQPGVAYRAANVSYRGLTSYIRTTADSAPVADQIIHNVFYTRVGADNASAGDAVAQSRVVKRTASDSASPADAASRTILPGRSATDSAPVADTPSRAFLGSRTVGDNIAIALAGLPTAQRGLVRKVISAVFSRAVANRMDTAERQYSLLRGAADAAPVTDEATRQATFGRTSDDAPPSMGDAPTRSTVLLQVVSDDATSSRVASITIVGSGLVKAVVTPVLNINPTVEFDAVARAASFGRSTTDDAPLVEQLASLALHLPFTDDVAFADDSVDRTGIFDRDAIEEFSVEPLDDAAGGRTRAGATSDSAPAVDAAVRVVTPGRLGVEALGYSYDAPLGLRNIGSGVIGNPLQGINRTSDSATLGQVTRPRVAADTAPVFESATRAPLVLRRGGFDAAPATDTGRRQPITFFRSTQDSITPQSLDIAARRSLYLRPLAETVGGSDSLVRSQAVTRTWIEVLPEVADQCFKGGGLVRPVQDSAPADDSLVRRAVNIRAQIEDVMGTREAITQQTLRLRYLSEIATAAEVIARVVKTPRAIADSIPLASEAITNLTSKDRKLTDRAPTFEAVSRRVSADRSTADDALAGDALFGHGVVQRSTADSALSGDGVSETTAHIRVVSEWFMVPGTTVTVAVVHHFVGPPIVTITGATRVKLSHHPGYDEAVVSFTFDRPTYGWVARANSTTPYDGNLLGSWVASNGAFGEASFGISAFGVETISPALGGEVAVWDDDLEPGDNEIKVYAEAGDGRWSS